MDPSPQDQTLARLNELIQLNWGGGAFNNQKWLVNHGRTGRRQLLEQQKKTWPFSFKQCLAEHSKPR